MKSTGIIQEAVEAKKVNVKNRKVKNFLATLIIPAPVGKKRWCSENILVELRFHWGKIKTQYRSDLVTVFYIAEQKIRKKLIKRYKLSVSESFPKSSDIKFYEKIDNDWMELKF